MLKKLLIGAVLLGLLVNIGLSFEIKTDKETYYCFNGVCDPVRITLIPDKIDLYKVIIIWDQAKGEVLTSAFTSYDTKTTLTTDNYITLDKLALTTATTSFYWNFNATGSGKFNISVYDSLGKLVYNLDPYWNTSCSYRKNITYYNNAWNNEDLLNFPVLLVLNSTNLNYSRTNETDIRFYDNNALRLDKEIEFWNITGNSYVWIRDPNISGTSDFIQMYYSCVDTDTNDYTLVWDKNYYLHIYHFGNNSQDSSFYGENGTITGAILNSTSPIGRAYGFTGDDDITITSPLLPLGTMNRTITALAKPISTGENSPMVSYSEVSSAGKRCNLASYQNKLTYWFYATDFISNLPITDNVWNYASGVLSSNAVIDSLYSAGVVQIKSDHSGIDSQQSDLHIGFEGSDNTHWTGVIDEVRIENTSRSSKWINATYFTIFNQFVNISGIEEIAPPEPDNYTIITPILPATENQTALPISFNISVEGSNDLFNCSIYINGTLNATNYDIPNNTNIGWSLSMLNGTYVYNYSCVGSIANNTIEYDLNVMVAYPPALSGTDIPLPYGDPTRQICLDNTTLYVEYTETIAYGGAETTFNRSKSIFCNWGCSANACNPAPFDNYLNMFKVFLLILAGIIGIFFISKKRF